MYVPVSVSSQWFIDSFSFRSHLRASRACSFSSCNFSFRSFYVWSMYVPVICHWIRSVYVLCSVFSSVQITSMFRWCSLKWKLPVSHQLWQCRSASHLACHTPCQVLWTGCPCKCQWWWWPWKWSLLPVFWVWIVENCHPATFWSWWWTCRCSRCHCCLHPHWHG